MLSVLDLQNHIQNIDEQLAEVTDRAARVARQAAADREELVRYILVGIGAVHLAIAIDDLSEVGPLPAITFLPNLPPWIQGVVNIRSEIVSVIDFGGFLNVPGRGQCEGNRLAVLRHKNVKIGIRVDRVIGTVHKAPSETKSLDSLDKNLPDISLFSSGVYVEKTFFYVLNVPKFLTAPRLINYNSQG